MPCGMCIRQSKAAYAGSSKSLIGYHKDEKLAALLENLSLEELLTFQHPLPDVSYYSAYGDYYHFTEVNYPCTR